MKFCEYVDKTGYGKIPKRYFDIEINEELGQSDLEKVLKGGIYYFGSVGVGKTVRAYNMLIAYHKKYAVQVAEKQFAINKKVYFLDSIEFFIQFKNGNTDEELSKYGNCDLLVIDDLGIELGTEYEKTILYQIINSRYLKCLPTVITSNLSLKELIEKSNNDSVIFKIVSRIKEMTTKIEMTGKDRRVK